MSRVVDFSKNPVGLSANITLTAKNYMAYDETMKYWEISTSNKTDGNPHSNCEATIQNFMGDFYFLMENIGEVKPTIRFFNRTKGPDSYKNAKCEIYDWDGLHWRYQNYYETKSTNFGGFDIANAPFTAKVRYHMAGFTLPVNAALFHGLKAGSESAYKTDYYDWQRGDGNGCDSSGNFIDATTAARGVTTSAIEELAKNENLRVYVIKYRPQAQCKDKLGNNITFSYDYIEKAATDTGGKTYEIPNDDNAETNLAEALKRIAEDIQNWAGYTEAENVVVNAGG